MIFIKYSKHVQTYHKIEREGSSTVQKLMFWWYISTSQANKWCRIYNDRFLRKTSIRYVHTYTNYIILFLLYLTPFFVFLKSVHPQESDNATKMQVATWSESECEDIKMNRKRTNNHKTIDKPLRTCKRPRNVWISW